MKKIIIYADDDRADLLAELLQHLDLIRSVEVEDVSEARIYPGGNFEIKPPGEKAEDKETKEMEPELRGSKNIEQLREALSAIESIRDKNKKRYGM